ncbi:exosome complex component RRP45 [Wyeomyia smithii]|uniref:exosome complex component RRP45 n=1 Tax=Wyeomyia smithii TaxID=174621 RepID=UPI002467B8B4|nr:exosome complex component RRP45 [Wyeomyia smithii]
MKERVLSNSEKLFVQKAVLESTRVDGRTLDEFRQLRINFGSEWGSVHVSLGETRVLAQVSCEVVTPRATRPNEGTLFINVELGPMAAAHFEPGRQSEASVQLNRILERAIKDSGCVDLESLCLVADEKVWNLRVDVNVLNHEGNIIDCASVAALTALAHFKRPDVSLNGEEVVIHTIYERDPISIGINHYPICVSYGIFNKGKIAIADPTNLEERVAEAKIVFGMNSYGELCGIHLGGITLTSSDVLLRTASKAAKRARMIVQKIKDNILEDAEKRKNNKPVGFNECIRLNEITALAQDRLYIRLKRFKLDKNAQNNDSDVDDESSQDELKDTHAKSDEETVEISRDDVPEDIQMEVEETVVTLPNNSAVLVPKSADATNQWIPEDEMGIEKSTKKTIKKKNKKKKRSKEAISRMNDIDDMSSSEEETITLTSDEINR